MKRLFQAAAIILLIAGTAAAEIKPAVVFDMGGKFDKSFNEGIYNGIEKFAWREGSATASSRWPTRRSASRPLRNFARRGYNPIIAVGFGQAPALEKGGRRVPGHQLFDHRHGGGPAQRAVDRVQGA